MYKSYKIQPERRKTEITKEWKRRLEADTPSLNKKNKKQRKQININLNYILYALLFFIIVEVIDSTNNNNQNYNYTNTVNTNANYVETSYIKNRLNITLNNAVRDLGNNRIKPSTNNLFLHVDLNIENTNKDIENMDTYKFSLKDNNGIVLKPTYLQYQNEIMKKSIHPNTISRDIITFELPLSYKGEMNLVYENNNYGDLDIIKFNLE